MASTSLQESRWGTRVVASELLTEVARLKAESSTYVLCYGGAQLASHLEANNLVDEYASSSTPSP